MKLSDVLAKLEQKIDTLLNSAKAPNITAEQHAALTAEAKALKTELDQIKASVTTLQTETQAAVSQHSAALQAKETEITDLKAQLADKQKLAEHGAAAAAELATSQAVPPVPAATEKVTTEEGLRKELAKCGPNDSVRKTQIARQIRELRGISLKSELRKATA